MRALLVNPEIPPSFWSWSRSVEAAGAKTLMPPLGLITAAGALPSDWELRLADLETRSITDDDWAWAEMVLVTGMLVQKHGFVSVIREAKQRGKPVAVGGPYTTSSPEIAREAGADFIVRGEGENTIPQLLEALGRGMKSGLFESDGRPDMTQSPTPRYDLLRLDDYTTIGVQTSRGCPFNCEFCDIVHLYGRTPRYKTPEQVISELEMLFKLGWRREIFISDDNFIGNKRHARSILDRLIPWMEARGKPFGFWAQTSLNLGRDLEMIDLLTSANFSNVFIGVESPEDEVLAINRKYQNIHNPPVESLNTIRDNGLTVMASFVLGFDGETKGAGERICDFVEQTGVPIPMLNLLNVLPNTSLWDRLKEEGRLKDCWSNWADTRLNFEPARAEAEIIEEYVAMYEYLFEPSRFFDRTRRYYLRMRPTRRSLAKKAGKPVPAQGPRSLPPLSYRAREIRALLGLLWRHGIAARYRSEFWRGLIDILRANPTRITEYLVTCFNGESMFEFRDQLRESARVRELHTAEIKGKSMPSCAA